MAEERLTIQVRLSRFHVNRFHQEQLPPDIQPEEQINFKHSIHVRIIDDLQTIATTLDVDIVRASNGQNLASISTEASFHLGEGHTKLKALGGVPRDLMLLAINLTYSTTRGILIERLRGTALQSAYLPIVNPDELLRNIEEAAKSTKPATAI